MSRTLKTVHQKGSDAAAAALRFQILCRSRRSDKGSKSTKSQRTHFHDDSITRSVRHTGVISLITNVWPNRNATPAQSAKLSSGHQTRPASSMAPDPRTARFTPPKNSQFSPSEARKLTPKPEIQPALPPRSQYRVPAHERTEIPVEIIRFKDSNLSLPPPLYPPLAVQPTTYRAAWYPFAPRQAWEYTSDSLVARLLRRIEPWLVSKGVIPKDNTSLMREIRARLPGLVRSFIWKFWEYILLGSVVLIIGVLSLRRKNAKTTTSEEPVESRDGSDGVRLVVLSPSDMQDRDQTPVTSLVELIAVDEPTQSSPVRSRYRFRGEAVTLDDLARWRADAEEELQRRREFARE